MNLSKIKIYVIALMIVIPGLSPVMGQSGLDLRINEILVENNSNYLDDFGEHSPWIEIFNSAYNPVDIGGLYLTDDISNPTKYRIPRGQQITLLPPRSYLIFWANNQPTHGIRHLNFTMRQGKTIALFDANGRTLIDSVTIPFSVQPDITYGRTIDGGETWAHLKKSTPGGNNDTEFSPLAADKFAEVDPTGFGMAFVAMMVVFFALALLFVFFKNMSRVLRMDLSKQKIARSLTKTRLGRSEEQETTQAGQQEDFHLSGEVNAAIAMTLYLYINELHDAENTILTINKVSRTYSPWSSKIYGLRKFPN
jgi:Na+-transporting methylmalonyl-CoA/oxaloacetate decarboxylase gamma subunit